MKTFTLKQIVGMVNNTTSKIVIVNDTPVRIIKETAECEQDDMTEYQCCSCKQFFTDEPKRLDAFVFCQKCHETKKNEFKKAFMERFQKLDEEIHKMHTDLVLFMTQNNIECVQ